MRRSIKAKHNCHDDNYIPKLQGGPARGDIFYTYRGKKYPVTCQRGYFPQSLIDDLLKESDEAGVPHLLSASDVVYRQLRVFGVDHYEAGIKAANLVLESTERGR